MFRTSARYFLIVGAFLLARPVAAAEDDAASAETTVLPDCHESTATHFRCAQSARCIPRGWLCDGQADCADGEDERHPSCLVDAGIHQAIAEAHCTAKQLACRGTNGDVKCVLLEWICDKHPDCADGADELDCDHETTKQTKQTKQTNDDGVSDQPLLFGPYDVMPCMQFYCQESGACVAREQDCPTRWRHPNDEIEGTGNGEEKKSEAPNTSTTFGVAINNSTVNSNRSVALVTATASAAVTSASGHATHSQVESPTVGHEEKITTVKPRPPPTTLATTTVASHRPSTAVVLLTTALGSTSTRPPPTATTIPSSAPAAAAIRPVSVLATTWPAPVNWATPSTTKTPSSSSHTPSGGGVSFASTNAPHREMPATLNDVVYPLNSTAVNFALGVTNSGSSGSAPERLWHVFTPTDGKSIPVTAPTFPPPITRARESAEGRVPNAPYSVITVLTNNPFDRPLKWPPSLSADGRDVQLNLPARERRTPSAPVLFRDHTPFDDLPLRAAAHGDGGQAVQFREHPLGPQQEPIHPIVVFHQSNSHDHETRAN